MPFEIGWYLPDRIVLITASGALTDEESDQLDKQLSALFEQSPSPVVHFIYDGTKQTKSPSMKAMLKGKAPKHPKIGWALIIGQTNSLIKFASMVVGHATNNSHFRFIETLPEALEFLAEMDKTLSLDQSTTPEADIDPS